MSVIDTRRTSYFQWINELIVHCVLQHKCYISLFNLSFILLN